MTCQNAVAGIYTVSITPITSVRVTDPGHLYPPRPDEATLDGPIVEMGVDQTLIFTLISDHLALRL